MAVSSLYEGLEVETKKPPLAGGDSSDIGWFHDDTSRMKFMSSQLQRTKILKDRIYSQQISSKAEQQLYPEDELPPPIHTALKSPPVQDPPSSSPMDTEIPPVTDSYNPMKPNDFEDFARDRAIRREIERLERVKKEEEERRRKQQEGKKRRQKRRSSSGSESDGERRVKLGQRGGERAAIPPPPGLTADTGTEVSESDELDSNPSKGPLVSKGLSVAANIMSKYGWKEGMGLGKESQGMSRALVVEKTSRRGGKILPNTPNTLDPERSAQVLSQLKNPSKVLLLQNMVGRGEVDEELNDEVSGECGKYGEVVKVVIFEIPEGVPDEESVRIFVEFTRNESAIKAYVDLNGRFFAGRVVKGSFFDEERFAKMDLGPIPLI